MAQINKPNTYFNTKLYTGNGSTQSITGVGFQPNMTWIKGRSDIIAHVLFDSVRGAGGNKELTPNETYAEGGNATISYGFLSSFDGDGFSVSQGTSAPNQADYTNKNSSTYASWNWLAGGTAVSNTDGTITSSVSVNQTAGFSIVSYTGNSTAGATIGHGLGLKPKMIIVKNRSGAYSWYVQHGSLGATQEMILDLTRATDVSGQWNNTEPTNSVFSVGGSIGTNASGNNYIAYCFAEKKGFSKISSYIGNGSSDGIFCYTGFKPAFVLTKSATQAYRWYMFDNKRNEFNVINGRIFANDNAAEQTNANILDFTSNGFKIRTSDAEINGSGQTIIYMAFAENPLVGTNNIPATAR